MKQITLTFAFAIALLFMHSDRARAIISRSAINPAYGPAQRRARPCVREDLRVKEGETDAAMGGVRATPYIFTNVSASACTLDGYPSLQLLNQRGAIVRRATKETLDDPIAGVTLWPGKTAWTNLNYNSGGAGHMGKPCPTYHRIRITLPGITRSFVLSTNIQTCAGTDFAVSSIRPGMPQ